MKFERKRQKQQFSAPTHRGIILDDGLTLTLIDIQIGDFKNDKGDLIPSDSMIFSSKNGTYKIPLRDYHRFSVADGGDLYTGEHDSEFVEYPDEIEIVSSEARKLPNGDELYPLSCYKKGDDYYKYLGTDNAIQWRDVIDSQLSNPKDPGAAPIQDYTIKLV